MIGRLNKEQVEEVLKSNVLGRLGCKDDQSWLEDYDYDIDF